MNEAFSSMTKDELVDLLEEREGKENPVELDLSELNFYGLSFKDVDFTGVNLSSSRFEYCSFINVNFGNANMAGVCFEGSMIRDSYATSAMLTDSTFLGSRLDMCNFQSVDFSRSEIRNCRIVSCNFDTSNFTGVDLDGSIVRACYSNYVLFEGASGWTFLNLLEMDAPGALNIRTDDMEVLAVPGSESWDGLIYIATLGEVVYYIPDDIDGFILERPHLSESDISTLKHLESHMQKHQEYADEMKRIWG